MSLFPAYNTNNSQKDVIDKIDEAAGPSWLNNSTFSLSEKKLLAEFSSSSNESSDEGNKGAKHPTNYSKKKIKKHKSKKEVSYEDRSSALFYEDTKAMECNAGFAVPQVMLTKPVRSYEVKKQKKRKKKKSRYFSMEFDNENKEKNSSTNIEPMEIQEFLKKTEMFNRTLRNEPHNIKMWLDYIELQDSGIGSVKGRAEKKLSILDRSLEVNPDADELLHKKMCITESIFPLDKVAAEAKAIVARYPKNMIGWLWTINSLQFNLSKMAAPGVLINYEKALEGINKAYPDSDHLLNIFLQCGLFLRQSGLWEQLLIFIELYLELNLTTAGSGAFKVIVDLPEDEIQIAEDGVITSGLPLGALWLRIERLREGIYFSPVEESSDPQRMVFREDLTSLLFPIARSSCTRLIVNCLLLLKVPPLPLTEAFYKYSRLNQIPWSLDSAEAIIAAKFSQFSGKEDYLDIVLELLAGPQYLINGLGQSQFFYLVNSIFEKCIKYTQADSECFLVWQMRWWRWTYSIQRIKDQSTALKKSFIKRAMQVLQQHSNCIPLFIEYALLEYEGGNLNACLKALEATIHLRSPPLIAGTSEKKELCALYKVYIEILVKEDINLYKEKILVSLVALAFGEPIKNIVLRDDLLTKSHEKFSHITSEILCDISDKPVELCEIIFPDYTVSWLACNAWFVFIHEGFRKSTEILEKALAQLEKLADNKGGNLITVMLEQLYEILVNITMHYCLSNPGNFSILYDTVLRAVQHFPNNALFYMAVYNCEIVGIKWQKLSSVLLSSGSALASALVYFITHTRLTKDQSTKVNITNRLQSLLERLRESHERCPLFWRLLLQASCYKDTKDIKRVFYRAVEKCPWVKLLYYETAKILPEDLPEIQDLLIEKELRLHITPEELEILREGS